MVWSAGCSNPSGCLRTVESSDLEGYADGLRMVRPPGSNNSPLRYEELVKRNVDDSLSVGEEHLLKLKRPADPMSHLFAQ